MIIKTDAAEMKKALDAVKRITGQGIWNSVLIAVSDDGAIVKSMGEGIYCECKFACKVVKPGQAVVGFQSMEVLGSYFGDVTMETKPKHLHVDGTMKVNLNYMDVPLNAFDRPTPFPKESDWIQVSSDIKKIAYIKGDRNQVLDCVWFRNEGAYTTDSFRMAYTKLNGGLDGILRCDNVMPLVGDEMFMYITEQRAWVKNGNLVAALPVVATKNFSFFDIFAGKTGSTEDLAEFAVPLDEMKRIMRGMYTLTQTAIDKTGTVSLRLQDDIVTIETFNSELGSGSGELKCLTSSGNFETGIGAKYLSEILSVVESPVFKWTQISIEGNKGYVLKVEDGDTLHVIMPKVPPQRTSGVKENE